VFPVKVLVSGASGQVGRALLDAVPAGIQAVGLSRQELDITDDRAVLECVQRHRPDVVINTAAYTAVDRAESESELAARVNVHGPRNLALALQGNRSRLVHVSTDYVFDGTSARPYPPEAATNPLSTYGRTKRAGEEAVLQLLPDRSVVLRTSWVYASRGHNFLLTMLRLMAKHGRVSVVADQVGTPTSAPSVATALWQVVQRPQLTGIYHWSDAGVASWYDFAVAIAEEAASRGLLPSPAAVAPIRTEDYPTAARRPSYAVLDKQALIQLGLEPAHWRHNLRRVLEDIAHA
jgi:dTDP-4-dehydrorhamnose reductase